MEHSPCSLPLGDKHHSTVAGAATEAGSEDVGTRVGPWTQFRAPSSFLEEGQLSRVMMFSRVGRHLPGKGTKAQVQLQWLLGCPCWPSAGLILKHRGACLNSLVFNKSYLSNWTLGSSRPRRLHTCLEDRVGGGRI